MSLLDQLKDMGFPEDKATIAAKRSSNLDGAIDWLEKNQDKSIEELQEDDDDDEGMPAAPALQPGETARSLVCRDCGKKFRSQAQAEFHASKSEHMNFEESTEEIAPLTEEERAAKLAELRAKLAAKRAGQSQQDKIDQKRNDEIKRKATKESQDIKEELARKEMIKEAEQKRQEKQRDLDAKKRVQAKIAADKEERRLKAEREKAARAGQAPPVPAAAEPAKPSVPKTSTSYTEARLRLQTPNGTIQKTFPVDATLFEVAQAVSQEAGVQISSFTQNFPKKIFDSSDMGQSLKEAGLVPSAALIAK